MQHLIKKRFTWYSALGHLLLVGYIFLVVIGEILVGLLNVPIEMRTQFFHLLFGVALALFLPGFTVFMYTRRVVPKERLKQVTNAATQQAYERISTDYVETSKMNTDTLKRLGDDPADLSTMVSIDGQGWRYTETEVTVFGTLGHVRYRSSFHFQAAVTVTLPRTLPNLYFDSTSRGKRMRYHIAASQKLAFEGDFDKYFTVYSPFDYEIDSLSFITPEVMVALIDVKDYDIEIHDNKLCVYCEGIPKYPAGWTEIVQKSNAIYQKLMHNITTYRDERVSTSRGRHGVSKFAHNLEQTPLEEWVLVAGMNGFLLFIIVGVVKDFSFGGLGAALVVGAMTFFFSYDLYRKYQKRRQRMEDFLKTVQGDK